MPDSPYILGMINARGGSKGVPRKNIKPLGGKPLIAWSIEVAEQVPEITRCIVSTEDQEIADIARRHGADIPFMRPDHLASDTAVQLDTIIYNFEKMEELEGREIDAVALLQPTQPFRTAEDVSGCISALLEYKADSAITIAPNKHHPYGLWTKRKDNKGLELFMKDSASVQGFNRQQVDTLYMRTGAVYVISRDTLLNKKSLYGDYVEGYVVDAPRSWINIDDLHDWEMAEAWLKHINAS